MTGFVDLCTLLPPFPEVPLSRSLTWMNGRERSRYMYTGVPHRTGSQSSFCSPVKWGTGCFTEKLFYHSGF